MILLSLRRGPTRLAGQLLSACVAVAISAGSAHAQSVMECAWDDGGKAIYKVASGSWQRFDDGSWTWREMDCEQTRFLTKATCSVEISDASYVWTLRVYKVEPGVWVESGSDSITVNRRDGDATFRQFGGTNFTDPSSPDDRRDNAVMGRCAPVADPNLGPRPNNLL